MSSADTVIDLIPSKSAEERARIRSNAERLLKSSIRPQVDEAERVIAALNEFEERVESEFIAEQKSKTPAERVREAFSKDLSETDTLVIQALLDNPGSTSAQLTKVCGWDGGAAWHLHFGQMCQRRHMMLWPAPRSEQRNADFFSGILADFDNVARTFTMKPDIEEALSSVGIRAKE